MRLIARTHRSRRSGKILVMFALFLTVLFGMLGLVTDGGMMMASHRQVQNAADSAALAAAMDLMRGSSSTTATASANTFVHGYNGLAGATVAVHIPPVNGPYAGNGQFVEVIVTQPYSTVFAHVNGASQEQTISARAVAGFQPVSSGEGAIVLDPRVDLAGITFNGSNTQLKVEGTVIVNAGGTGYDQYGLPFPPGASSTKANAVVTSNKAVSDPKDAYVLASHILVRGGVDTPANFKNIDDPANNPTPLYTGIQMAPDPLRLLDTPQISNKYVSPTSTTATGTIPTRYAAQKVSTGDTVTFNPGVYEDINITGGSATFRTGIYVISPSKPNQGLRISGGRVQSEGWASASDPGPGVMFYFAADNYVSTNPLGAADRADGAFDGPLPPNSPSTTLPADSGNVKLAALDVAGGIDGVSDWVRLGGLLNYPGTTENDRILFFGRRKSQTVYKIGGNGSSNAGLNFTGTIYAKWSEFDLAGGGSYDAQFIVGRLSLGGGASMTLKASGVNRGLANQVYLVE